MPDLTHLIKQLTEFLRNLINREEKEEADKEYIQTATLLNAVKRDFGDCHIFLSDREFYCVSGEQMRGWLREDMTDKQTYEAEKFDCDDFSFVLKGEMAKKRFALAFGIAWVWWMKNGAVMAHACNCYYDRVKREMMMIEPQNDRIFPKPDSWRVFLVVC